MKSIRLNGRGAQTPRGARFGARAGAFVFAALALALAACESAGPRVPIGPIGQGRPDETAPVDDRRPVVDALVTPPHRASQADQLVRVGLLLPLSSPIDGVRAEAASMLNAAQLAIFETDSERLVLIPKDTGGTADGARSQARAVLREGAEVILGPLLADSVRAAADEASVYDVPVIAFSNDQSVTETGAWLLSRTPAEEVRRVVQFSAEQGIFTFAALVPSDDYGYGVLDSLEDEARAVGGFLTTFEEYPAGGDATMVDPAARRLSRVDQRQGQGQAYELPYDAVLLPEGGVQLLSIAPLLPYYDVDPRITRFLGTSRWRDNLVANEPSLAGGWFPGPDADALGVFENSYRAAFGGAPSRLAPLAYDAVLVTASLTRSFGAAGLSEEALTRSTGFRGADGLFRFNADHLSEHAMAIYEVRGGRFVVVDPAPAVFDPPVF